MSKEKYVMCVPTRVLKNLDLSSLYVGEYNLLRKSYEDDTISDEIQNDIKENICWVWRDKAETNPNYKQILPYVIVKDPQGNVLRYSRGKSGGEDRLHSLYSVGFGGHIDLESLFDDKDDIDSMINNTIIRECDEEIFDGDEYGMDNAVLSECKGIITANDEVGLVHIGLLYEYQLTEFMMDYLKAEHCIENMEFVSISDLKKEDRVYEPWSKAVIRDYLEDKYNILVKYKDAPEDNDYLFLDSKTKKECEAYLTVNKDTIPIDREYVLVKG